MLNRLHGTQFDVLSLPRNRTKTNYVKQGLKIDQETDTFQQLSINPNLVMIDTFI